MLLAHAALLAEVDRSRGAGVHLTTITASGGLPVGDEHPITASGGLPVGDEHPKLVDRAHGGHRLGNRAEQVEDALVLDVQFCYCAPDATTTNAAARR